jgi:hypothetical protein
MPTPTPPMKTLVEITEQAMQVLSRELGSVDTMRFIRQFTNGSGNYTAERENLLGNPSVQELADEMRKRKKGA